MTDINVLKENLQLLEPLLKERAAASEQYETNAEKLAPIEDRLGKTRGLKRLKKPFIGATKTKPLQRKQKKIVKRLAAKDLQIIKTLDDIYTGLDKALTRDPAVAARFNYLQDTFNAIEDTKKTLLHAAKKCNQASLVENIVGLSEEDTFKSNNLSPNIPGIVWNVAAGTAAHFNAKSAGKSITKAQQALQSLQNEVKDTPKLNTLGVDYLNSQSHWALMNDVVLGGGGYFSWGSWGNWNLARNFRQTKNQLLDVAGKLDQITDRLVDDKVSLLMNVAGQAKETSPYIGKLLSSLQTYVPSVKPPAQAKPNNAKPQQ